MFWWADGSWFYWLSELILSNWYLTQGNSVGVFFLRALSSWWNQACKVSYQTSGITICSLESLDRPERKRRRQESQCQLSIWSYSRALSGNQRFSIWSCFRALSDNWQLPHDYWMVIYQFHNCYCYLHVKIKHLQYIRAFWQTSMLQIVILKFLILKFCIKYYYLKFYFHWLRIVLDRMYSYIEYWICIPFSALLLIRGSQFDNFIKGFP